ncbi:MAG TPA: DoxX family protein [Polyangiaceae bacterium]|nr:DoxX family protein [Polyangiaceae bacterium]
MSTFATMGRAAQRAGARWGREQRVLAAVVVVVGRVLFGLIFIVAAPGHFQQAAITHAAAHGVLFPSLLVPLSGLISFFGGLSVILGYRARLGAWLLVVFLVPVTLAMHDFWHVHDPTQGQIQMAMFMKNVALLGAALLITHFGPGPLSFDARRGR